MFNEDACFYMENDKQYIDPKNRFMFFAFDKSLQIKGPFFAFVIRNKARDHGRYLFTIIAIGVFKLGQ